MKFYPKNPLYVLGTWWAIGPTAVIVSSSLKLILVDFPLHAVNENFKTQWKWAQPVSTFIKEFPKMYYYVSIAHKVSNTLLAYPHGL
jgi:hypothetical protein